MIYVSPKSPLKECAHCGTENAPQATQCRQCGSTEFKPVVPPLIPHQKAGKPTPFHLRILVAIGVWVVVTGLSLWVAWHGIYDAALETRDEQYMTQEFLSRMADTMEKHHATSGIYPKSMNEVRDMMTNELTVGPGNQLLDGWERPFNFSLTGSNCLVTSYGRDGKPGGQGLDCDLTSKDWNPKAAFPTFKQFLFEMNLEGVINSCLVCGGMAGLLALLTVKIPDTSRNGLIVLAIKLSLTTLGAVAVAVMISALHIPDGH